MYIAVMKGEHPENAEALSLSSRWIRVRDFTLFMFMGAGANFVLPTALVQEVPYFENVLPERLCVATWMNLMTGLGLLSMLAYLYINAYVRAIPYAYSVPFMLITSTVTSFVVAGVYSVTINKVSALLFICCFVGGSVGAMSSVIMNPFTTIFTNDSISAVRAGGSGFTLLCALIAAAQRPGSSGQTFSASAYLAVFGILLSFSIPAYYYIMHDKLGRRPKQRNDSAVFKPSSAGRTQSALEIGDGGRAFSVNPLTDGSVMQSFEMSHTSAEKLNSMETIDIANPDATSLVGINTQPAMDYIARMFVSDTMEEKYPWLRRTVPYMMVVGWVNFNTWGILSAMVPFAISNAYNSDGSGNLGIAYQVAAVLLVLGDLSTTVFKLNLLKGTIVFTVLCIVIYCAAMDAPGMSSPAAGPMIIVIFALERFIEAHLVTAALRAIATDFPLVYREEACRAVGIANQVSTTVGAVLSAAVVYSLFKCN
jgi:hypothetical protein